MRSFVVHKEAGRFVIRSEHLDEFAVHPEPDTDAAAAQRTCDLLNIGFRLGYSVGEADAQIAQRRAMGMD
jgi:hypothetical protein